MLCPGGGVQPVRRLRHRARLALFAGRPPWQRRLLRAAMVLAWPAGAMLEVRRRLSGLPQADRPAGLRGWIGRAAHMLALAWLHNIPPRDYVAYRLHDPARRDRVGTCLYGPEIEGLTTHLNRLNGAVDDDVQDKARFARLCRDHGLPCIPTLAVFRAGAQPEPAPVFLPDLPALWVKDLAGSRGSGAACWRREGKFYRDVRQGGIREPAELLATWRARDCIVQPRLDNHPALAPLSDGFLVDFRVISGIGRDGRVAVVAALAQLPCGGLAARHIFAAVDGAGGLRSPQLGLLPVTHHPDTGAAIAGTIVPFWPDALALVVRAHGQVPEFARFTFLGWDVAITADGPLLIETNAGWGGINHQLGEGEPLGLTALPDIALDHLEDHPPCG